MQRVGMGHVMGPNQYYLRHLCLVEVGNVKEIYLTLNTHQSLQTTCALLKMLISQTCSRIGTHFFYLKCHFLNLYVLPQQFRQHSNASIFVLFANA